MATSLEERVAQLEAEMAGMRSLLVTGVQSETPDAIPWWKQIAGVFADDRSAFDEAMRLGRAYREAQRPPEDDASNTEEPPR